MNFAFTVERSAKDGVLGHEPVVVGESGHVRQYRSIEPRGETPRDVSSVVARRDEDRVGHAGAFDERLDRRGDRDVGQRSRKVAYVIERRGAVLPGLAGQ